MHELGLFAKHWTPGLVKTRLSASLGAERATRIYELGLRLTVQRLASLGDRRVLCFWPPEREGEFARLAADHWELQPQVEGDLGMRLQTYFQQSLQRGATRTVVVGADSPTIPLDFIARAFEALETCDVVLGPSADGGYYLLGGAQQVPPAFVDIAWGGPQVRKQTLSQLQQAGCRVGLLAPWYDVDRTDDLPRLLADLTAGHATCPIERQLIGVLRMRSDHE